MTAQPMTYRRAKAEDCELLGELNYQLIRDEGHRNRATVAELAQRMRGWLAGEYEAVLFELGGAVVAYAVFCEQPEMVYLRQFFVLRDRRRQGIGRRAMELLRSELWPKNKRLLVEALVQNEGALAFWHAMGYHDYCMTLEILPPAESTFLI